MANAEFLISGTQAIDENRRTVQAMRIDSAENVTSESGTSFFTEPRIARLSSESDLYFNVGSNVAADSDDTLFVGGTVEYFKIGSNEQIQVSGGTLNVTTMN